MGDELKTIGDSIQSLKASFEARVNDLKTGMERVEKTEAAIEELKTKVAKGEATIGELVEAKEEVKKQRTAVEETNKKLDDVIAQLSEASKRLDEVEAAAKRLPQGPGEEEKSIGRLLVESDAYKAFNPATDKTSAGVLVKSFFPRSRKANELTGASLGNTASYLYPTQRVPGIIGPPMPQARVRDLFPVLPTSVGAVDFVRESGFTNNAAATAENTSKSQSVLTFEYKSVSVKTIAHWLPATRQIIADAPALQQYVETRLVNGLALEEDDEILNGDGTGAHLTGLLTDENIQTLSQSGSDNKADAIRKAMTLVEITDYAASGIILHPNDWEDIELLKDEEGRYIWARVQETNQRRLWGLPVVTTTKIAEGSSAVGAFDLAAAIWDREEASVRISAEHSDFFIKNLVAILAEERLALTVYRPEAVALVTFTGEGS